MNETLETWLQQMSQSGHLTTGNVDELRDHILSRAEQAIQRGHSEELAIKEAIAAMGSPSLLMQEYQKANAKLYILRHAALFGAGIFAYMGLWVAYICLETTISFAGMMFHIRPANMEMVMSISIILGLLGLMFGFSGFLARTQRSLDLLRSSLHRRPNAGIFAAIVFWLATLGTQLMMWRQWQIAGPGEWQADDWMYVNLSFSAAFHLMLLASAILCTIFCLRRLPRSLWISYAIFIGGMALPWVLISVGNALDTSGIMPEFGNIALVLFGTFGTGILLRRMERRRLWPA